MPTPRQRSSGSACASDDGTWDRSKDQFASNIPEDIAVKRCPLTESANPSDTRPSEAGEFRTGNRICSLFTMSMITPAGCRNNQAAELLSSTDETLEIWHQPNRSGTDHVGTPGKLNGHHEDGGARRDRTDDLMLAKHALSQLSYGPVSLVETDGKLNRKRRGWKEWWAWEDLNFRPHAYQARALTN